MRILAVSLKHSHKSFEDEYMSLINTEVKAFNATAYQNGEFIELSEQNLKGKWSVVFFILLISLLCVQQNWVT